MTWRSAGLGLVVSSIAILLTLRSVNLGEVWRAFLAADIWLFLSVLIIMLIGVFLRAWRWKLLFLPQNKVRITKAYAATHLSYLFSTLLPGRAGELVRGFLIVESEEVPPGHALGTIFIEKLLDVLMLLLMLGCLILLSGWRDWSINAGFSPPDWVESNAGVIPSWAQATGITALAIFGSIAVTFFLLSRMRHRAVKLIRKWVDPLPILRRLRPSQLAATALSSADGLARPRLLASVLTISVVMWVVGGLSLVVALNAFTLPVPSSGAFLLLVVTNLGMTIPSAPGYVGVYHALSVSTLILFPSVSRDEALSFSIAIHALAFGGLSLTALFFLWIGDYRIEELIRRSKLRMRLL